MNGILWLLFLSVNTFNLWYDKYYPPSSINAGILKTPKQMSYQLLSAIIY
jgi:hypothetical protein